MPWRQDTRPYFVLVSELMLQQTQVARVVPKFEVFIERFPNEKTLASANLSDVLKLWQGLGYNRRAKYLHDAVTMIMNDYGGTFPKNETDILQLPGHFPAKGASPTLHRPRSPCLARRSSSSRIASRRSPSIAFLSRSGAGSSSVSSVHPVAGNRRFSMPSRASSRCMPAV